jgi:mycofactocin precursor
MPEMSAAPTTPDIEPEAEAAPAPEPAEDLVESDLLVEDVSIDGMCGVY